MDIITLNVSADAVAWYGALVATASFIFSMYNILRDRAKVHIEIMTGRWVAHGERLGYKRDKFYTAVTVSNRGRRSVTIGNVGFMYLDKQGGALLVESVMKGSRELKEGKSTEYLVEEDHEELKRISYFTVSDAAGRTYKKYFAPLYKVLLYNVLHWTYLHRREPLVQNKKS